MNKLKIEFFSIFILMLTICLGTAAAQEPYPVGKIALIVDNRIYSGIQTKLNSYISALQSVEQMSSADIIVNTSYDMNTPIATIRAALNNYYLQNNISGAILIGDIKRAAFEEQGSNSTVIHAISVDKYFMDLVYTSEPWKDYLTASPNIPGVFDSYEGDQLAEIWVSRIMARNFTQFRALDGTLLSPKTNVSDEIRIINDYLQRAIDRMTLPAKVPQNGFLMADNGDPAPVDAFLINFNNLNLPYFKLIGNPDDNAQNWVNYLRKTGDDAYEWAFLCEHSCPTHSNFQQNHNPAAGTFVSHPSAYNSPYNYLNMTIQDGTMGPPAASQVPFYMSYGCSNANIVSDDCVVQCYGMGQNGLISMGYSQETHVDFMEENAFLSDLAKGMTFGQATLNKVNRTSWQNSTFNLIGAGILRAREYVPYSNNINRIIAGDVINNYSLTNKRPFPSNATNVKLFLDVISGGPSFQPENATYNWISSNYSSCGTGNPFALPITLGEWKSVEVKQNGYLPGSRTGTLFPTDIEMFLDPVFNVGPVEFPGGGIVSHSDGYHFQLRGKPIGTGKIAAGEAGDDNDNFVAAPIKEPGENIRMFQSSIYYFAPCLENPAHYGDWSDVNHPAQGGIMVRETDANGNTTPGSPYVSLYMQYNFSSNQYYIYHQYRTAQNDHAVKQLVGGPYSMSTENGLSSYKMILERTGTTITAYIQNGQEAKIAVGNSIDFNPSFSRYMLIFSGQSQGYDDTQAAHFVQISYDMFPKGVFQISKSGTVMTCISKGNSGSLFIPGNQNSGTMSGLLLSNAASISSTGDLTRSATLMNKKAWLDYNSNLSGGLVIKDPVGNVIAHIANNGTISVRGGVLEQSKY